MEGPALTTVVGSYPYTMPLKDGRVTSKKLTLTHLDLNPIRAFRPMVNDLAYDVSEMAIVTFLLAKAKSRPLVLLPVVLHAQPELALLVTRVASPLRTPADLAGKTIGVRSYTQATATWVRGILSESAGVDLERLRWRTLEPSHVDGFEDPPNAERMPAGSDIFAMLEKGEIDAAVISWEALKTPGIRTLLDDAAAREADWRRRTGVWPVNHLLSVKRDVVGPRPWIADELVSLFGGARKAAGGEFPTNGPNPGPWGLEANRAALATMARFAAEQGIAPRVYSVEELLER